jgi:hypothetical protein
MVDTSTAALASPGRSAVVSNGGCSWLWAHLWGRVPTPLFSQTPVVGGYCPQRVVARLEHVQELNKRGDLEDASRMTSGRRDDDDDATLVRRVLCTVQKSCERAGVDELRISKVNHDGAAQIDQPEGGFEARLGGYVVFPVNGDEPDCFGESRRPRRAARDGTHTPFSHGDGSIGLSGRNRHAALSGGRRRYGWRVCGFVPRGDAASR